MSQTVEPKYRAFISYSHEDADVVREAHRKIEDFRIDDDLAGRITPMGKVPTVMHPVCMDRNDFGVARSVTDESLARLKDSRALVVFCSPAAAASKWVDLEVKTFRDECPGRPIIAVILSGTPGGATGNCYPPSMPHGAGMLAADQDLAALQQ